MPDPKTKILDERSTLMALLLDMPLGPPAPVLGIAEMSTDDKLFLLATCCANFVAETIWISSRFDQARALEGIDAIVQGIIDNIKRRTNGEP